MHFAAAHLGSTMKKKFRNYEVIGFDVWGNEKDGYEVNDAYHTGDYVTLPLEASDADIIRAVKQAGQVRSNFRTKSFRIDGEPEFALYIEHDRLGPVCELRLCSDDDGPPELTPEVAIFDATMRVKR